MFSPKDPRETKTLTFDFADDTSAPLNPVVTVTVASGVDPSPSAIKVGSAVVSGTKVLQQVTAGVAGVIYHFLAEVDDAAGDHHVLTELLPVETKKP